MMGSNQGKANNIHSNTKTSMKRTNWTIRSMHVAIMARRKTKLAAMVIALTAACTLGGFRGETPTTITLDAARAGEIISPQLFGHNLEHTRKAVWQGISAQMVANRKFAATDCGLPMRWHTLNGTGVSLDEKNPYVGRHSVRLECKEKEEVGIWQQHDWLTFEQGRNYAFRIWLRADREQTLRMQIISREGFYEVFSGQTLIQVGDWQLWSGEFVSPMLAKGSRFQLVTSTPGTTWIGAVSLMPANHFHGMRRDVVDLLKELKPGNLRWPGGCFAEYYYWKDGLLPVDQRPPIGPHQWVGLLPDSDGFDNHEIGIDEFIALCRELNCDPHITIRYGEGTVEEAASWVEYCNGDENRPMGKVRAERGYREPYGVRYWYVGNEMAGMSLVKNKDPKALAVASTEFARAMKEVDGSLVLNSGVPPRKAYLKPQFDEAGDLFEMVQCGFYFKPEERYTVGAERILTGPESSLNLMRSLRRLVDNLESSGKPPGLTFYEWNVMWDRDGDALSGVFAAEMLNLFCRESDVLNLAIASYFQPVSEGAIAVGPTSSVLEPDGHVFVLYAAHQGNRLLKIPSAEDQQIDLCASIAPDGESIFVTLINEDTEADREVVLSVDNFKVLHEASAEVLVSQTLEVGGQFSRDKQTLPIQDGKQVRLRIPPFSVAGVKLNTQ
jgi:alpha-L-arabinofuranosidase